LNNQLKELKNELNKYKYAEKIIKDYNKKISVLKDTINRLNEKNENLKNEINNYKLKESQNNNESIRIKSPIKKNQIRLGEQRSSSMMNMYVKKFEEKHKDKDHTKENGNFYSSGKNFYKLFNDTERKAISVLFNSAEDLNNFKKKISIIENRNNRTEELLKNEKRELSKMNSDKDEKINIYNKKIEENERRISQFQNQLKNQKKINTNLMKKSQKQEEVEKIYKEVINQKEEQIKKLKDENTKLNNILETMKTDVNKVNIEKSKEKELKELNEEIGVIQIIDVNKVLNIEKKFSIEILQIQKEIEMQFFGIVKVENKGVENNIEESTISVEKSESKKKKKKRKNLDKKEGDKNGGNNVNKFCKKK
jgi:demethoxyubiquinone hydroxylase (CLK1/Coq7/Cat5 family)